jgi:tetratricopeptide (TPR) repeat protein/predicted Ser/Thr protein kinase
MDPAAEQWARVRALLAEALELEAPARLHFTDAIEDPLLRVEVKAYLAWAPDGGPHTHDPLEHHPWITAGLPATLTEGSRLASYRLLKELGTGGMGTVYLAERDDREFEQRVAIKVVRHGLRSEEILRLFRRERQILANLSHPSIARLVDGGVTGDGRPFFVMEYVDGIRIDNWCQLHRLALRQRLQLFLLVCSAVQAAHQSLVVHRDLKPANILVTADGIPKLLDFGVAKLLDQQASSDATVAMLTPRYASPEHMRGEASGAATDIYSLGVLLFELLTGRPPLSADGDSLPTFLRTLQEDTPRRPSDVAPNRAQRRELAGDLDNIVLHSLEKSPARRYPSVESFAADLQRYLDGFPVHARPASWRYRAGKFVRRQRTLVASALVLTVVALVSLAAVLHSARLAEHQRALAQLRFDQGRELARFYILEVDKLLERLPGSTPARALITGHTLAYLDRLAPEAAGDIPLLREFATAYERVAMSQGTPLFANMGDQRGALANVGKGIRIRRQILASSFANPDDRLAYGDILLLLGHLKLSDGSPSAAIAVYLQAAREFEAVRALTAHPPGRVLSRLGSAYQYAAVASAGNGNTADTGDVESALPLFAAASSLMPLERKARASQPPQLRIYLASNEALLELFWAEALSEALRPRDADKHFLNALRLIHSPEADSGNAEIARKEGLVEGNYAIALIDRGELRSASAHLKLSSRVLVALFKKDPENVASQQDLAWQTVIEARLDLASGRYTSGLAKLDRAIAQNELLLAGNRDLTQIRSTLSHLYLAAGDGWIEAKQPARARLRYSQALEFAATIAAQHPDNAIALLTVASAEVGLGQYGRAAAAARTILAAHPDHAKARKLLARALSHL